MPKFQLSLKANLENIAELRFHEDFEFGVKIKCTSCNEVSDNAIFFNKQDKSEISGSRGSANLVSKCKFCSREGTIDVLDGPKPYRGESSGKFQPVASFECRGFEPVEWIPGAGFSVEASSGTEFDDVNLTEKEWVEYDEQDQQSIGIYDLESKFDKTK